EIVELSGLLHDVGKIGVPEAVLTKPSRLTDSEYQRIMLHPVQGAEIVRNIRHPNIEAVVRAVRHHHERWDGNGYPDGLAGERICRTSRILAVADTYDAMTSDRPYRKGMDREKALGIIREVAGTQLDRAMVEAFMSAVSDGAIQEAGTVGSTRKSKYIGTRGIWSIVDTCNLEKVKKEIQGPD
ncbi:MAG: HD domain-containing protein, partial [Deltaproteobacteria bacterium]|nr:HD domain-containing protein [Deltaproteobacteria bacterium]